jgi:hypothetical protein
MLGLLKISIANWIHDGITVKMIVLAYNVGGGNFPTPQ